MKKLVANLAADEEILDASNLILGRMASYVAKQALEGKKMIVLNSEHAVISGTKARVVARAKLKLKTRTLGNQEKAPTHPRRPDNYVRRVIRGMLPWKKPHGKEAFHRVTVYIGVPKEFEGKTHNTILDANVSKLRVPYITVSQLAEEIGGIPA